MCSGVIVFKFQRIQALKSYEPKTKTYNTRALVIEHSVYPLRYYLINMSFLAAL